MLLRATLTVLVLLVAACSTASAATPASAIGVVNAARTAAGIPPLVEDPALTSACRAGVGYLAINGSRPGAPHAVVPGATGATEEAARGLAGSVLATGLAFEMGDAWSRGNPWINAPYHLTQMLDPDLARTGYAEKAGNLCFFTGSAARRTALPEAVAVWPPDGAADVPYEQRAAERNSRGEDEVPGSHVGLGSGTPTGPYLYVWPERDTAVAAASLVGPAGPVEVRTVPGFVIPAKPLAPRTTYTARVVLDVEPVTCRRRNAPPSTFAQVPCPDDVAPYCVPVADAPAEQQCAPGQPATVDDAVIPGRRLERTWSFRTGSNRLGVSVLERLPEVVRLPKRATGRRLRVTVPDAYGGRSAQVMIKLVPACAANRASWSLACDKRIRKITRSLRLRAPATTLTLPKLARGGLWDVELRVKKPRGGFESSWVAESYRVR